MKRKTIWIILGLVILIISALPFGLFYVLNNGNPYTKYIANKNVPVYLEEIGYTEDELEKAHYVEPKHMINNEFYQGHYLVVFKDEQDVTYYYGVTKKGKNVKQFCEKDKFSTDGVTETIEEKTKHSEKDCVKSL